MLKALLFLVVVAVATYLLVRAVQQRGLLDERTQRPRGDRAPRASRPRRSAPPRMVAPDDDEEFLRELDRRRLNPDDPDNP